MYDHTAVASLFFIPTVYIFDQARQSFWCKLILFSNLVIFGTHILFFLPTSEHIVIDTAMVKDSIMTLLVGVTAYNLMLLHFNSLSNKMYEDVKTTNEALESNTREKEAFFATISHEIRNPLQSLLSAVELLNDFNQPGNSNPESTKLLEICKGCCALVINLVSNILDMSKIAAQRMQLSPVAADVREICSRILRVSRGRAEGRNLRLELIAVPGIPPAVEFDTQRVEQILHNLVSNAIKFTAKGRIVVRLEWIPLATMDQAEAVVSRALAHSNWKHALELPDEGGSRGLNEKYCSATHASDRAKARSALPSRSSSGSRLVLSAPKGDSGPREKQGVIKLEVMDTGIGIKKESLGRLFKAYQQADASISRLV